MKYFVLIFVLLLTLSACEKSDANVEEISEKEDYNLSEYNLTEEEIEILENPAYENIFSEGTPLPGRCTLLGEFNCRDFRFNEDGLFLELITDRNLTINHISINTTEDSLVTCKAKIENINLIKEEKKILRFDCDYEKAFFHADIIVNMDDSEAHEVFPTIPDYKIRTGEIRFRPTD